MNKITALDVLRRFQAWRQDKLPIDPHTGESPTMDEAGVIPREVGVALDVAIETLQGALGAIDGKGGTFWVHPKDLHEEASDLAPDKLGVHVVQAARLKLTWQGFAIVVSDADLDPKTIALEEERTTAHAIAVSASQGKAVLTDE